MTQSESNPPAPEPAKKKPRRRRRRLIITAIVLVCLIFAFRAAISLLLPSVMNKVAHTIGLECTYDRLDLSILGGTADLWNLQFRPEGGGDPILQTDYCQADISISELLHGRLVVFRAASDGVYADIQRNADGTIPLLAKFTSSSSAAQSKPAATATNSTPDLTPPLRLDALRLQHIRARFHDLCVHPQVDTELAFDLRLTNLGTPGQPTRFELDCSSDPILDTLRVEGQATGDATKLNANLNVVMRGLHLVPAQGYLAALGLHPTGNNISATMTGNLSAAIAPNPADGIKGQLSLDNARLTSDGAEAAALDHLNLDINSLSAGSVKLGKLTIDGVRCAAGRDAPGNLTVAGVELVPAPPQPAVAEKTSPMRSSGAPFQWSLNQILLGKLHVGFVDQSVAPQSTLALDSNRIELDNLSNDARPSSPTKISVSLTAPGMVRAITVTGEATPFADAKTFKLDVKANGINPTAVEPYLSAAGLSSEWIDGQMSVSADGSLSITSNGKLLANAHVANFQVSDGTELLSLSEIQIKGVAVDAANRSLSVASVDGTGPGVNVRRDAEGNIHLLGIKTGKPVPPSSPQPTQSTAVVATPNSAAFQNFSIAHFGWKGVHVAMTDESVASAASFSIDDAGVNADGLSLQLGPATSRPSPGKFQAWLVAPQLASRLSVDGDIASSADRTQCNFNVTGEGIHGDSIAVYLKPLGIEPAMKSGSLAAHGTVELDTTGTQPRISLACNDVKYNDGNQSLASVTSFAVNGVSVNSNGVSVDSLSVHSPHAQVTRGSDGIVQAAGLRFVGVPATQPAVAEFTTTRPATAPASAFTATLRSLDVTEAVIDWIDQFIPGGVETKLNLDAGLTDFTFAPDSHTAPFHVTLAVDGTLDKLTAEGQVSATPSSASLRANVDASGIRAGSAAAYLPPGIRATLKNGTFHTAISANIAMNPGGGQLADLSVTGLDYRDTGDTAPLASFDSFHIHAPRVDPAGKKIAFDEITLAGFETRATKTTSGLDLLGLELTPTTQPTAARVPSPQTSTAPESAPATTQSTQDILRQIAAQRGKLPLLTLGNLDLGIRRITVTDATKPSAAPLVIADVRVHNSDPIALLGEDAEANPTVNIDITGRVDPVAGQFHLHTKLSPFTRQKTLGVDVSITGIHGKGLTDIDPDLATMIDGESLQQGQLSATLSASLKLQTVRPTDFDLSHGGSLDFDLSKVEYRAEPQGPVLAGIGDVHSDGIVLAPNLAGAEVHELEIDNLVGRAENKPDGLHALGLVVKIPTTQPATVASASTNDPTPSQSAAPDPPPNPASEYKIDRLIVSGIDFRAEDDTCNPPALFPINGLDLEAQDLSSLAMSQDKPVRFNVLATADKVPLPAKSGQAADRVLFSQMAANGVVSMYPKTKGWTKLSLSGFELTGVRGIAAEKKVTVGAGTFDSDFDIRFPGNGTIDTSNRIVFTDLSVSEPPDGFIHRTLQLPAPLDVVIGVLQDQDGSITIPLNVPLNEGKVDSASVTASVSAAFLQIVGTAIATAPLKVTGLFGVFGKPSAEQPIQFTYPTGYSAIPPDQLAALKALALKLHNDKSLVATLKCDCGSTDVALARERVNPSIQDISALADSLARRRSALMSDRLEAAAQVRALLGATDTENASRGIERLRNIDRQLAGTETAMDNAYDLLRPGADHQAARRTQAATLAIAHDRSDAIRLILLSTGRTANAPDRIHLINPQFTESPDNAQGMVTITLVKTK